MSIKGGQDTTIPQSVVPLVKVGDEAGVHKELGDRLEWAASTMLQLNRSRTMTVVLALNEGPIQQGEGSTVPVESHHTLITTPSTSHPPLLSPSKVHTPPHDLPLPGGHTPGSDEGKEPTELVKDLGRGEKGEKEISTANISVKNCFNIIFLPKRNISVKTASATPEVSIAAANLVYIRRSAEKRKDKGKAIMKEDDWFRRKAKEASRARIRKDCGHEEAIRLQGNRLMRRWKYGESIGLQLDKARDYF
ncbi:hypothetical protein Tco_0145215 [Tanacetum coccineum]